ncbi:hypothetical protein SAMN04487967_1703 [Natronorubrum sediminis]|uniref:Uncharacterized protein n=1 Tax=Natronorubrum sediminis TaxID=640943 RepID=A0A1H6FV33_9EURY|nr:hypothetical protein SAMN04487967_1703 [Natronorubrum sediminis]
MTVTLQYLADAVRFTLVDLAHELRRDYERGVFSRQTLAMVGLSGAGALFSLGRGQWGLSLSLVGFAALITYSPARADRRWRDRRRNDP